MDSLKPCPFCGGRAIVNKWHSIGKGYKAEVECLKCTASVYSCIFANEDDAEYNAVAQWNRSTNEQV